MLFFTIHTDEGTTFYQVIDLDKKENNVYFLQVVEEKSLRSALAAKPEEEVVPGVGSEAMALVAAAGGNGNGGNSGKGSGNKNIIIPGVIIMGVLILGRHFLKKGKAPAAKASRVKADFYDDSDDEVISEEDFKEGPAET
jgi:hypothetical protein